MEVSAALNTKERRVTKRRAKNVRRCSGERRRAAYTSEARQQPAWKYHPVLELLIPVFAGVLGIGVLLLTELFNGVPSTGIRILLAIIIIFSYAVALRRAMYS